ncbi:PREDICTED: glucan endo-1,3-beta-glucosidase 12 isoform X2 [Ipomoea nil]|uniref:glucan endo-1,3-beta-glucosidase 12 isoform X2 n=1 Tax=Ipomoea nil TaxID=35883 RepID=UPI000900F7C4|nr:PREDICTED: glucan endo-1,3-beta-glucosidase 12 isoform X2 [Ipomoea nil]
MAKKFQLSASSPHCALPSHFPQKMFNLSCFFLLFLLHFAAVNVAGDEAVGLQAFSGVPVFLCGEERVGLVLPSMKNIHYSLTRWGLGGEIKVSTSFSPSCLQYQSYAETYVKPVVEFFREIDAPYLVTPSSDLSISEFIKNLGGFSLKKIHLMAENERQERAKPRSRSRRLSLFDSLFADSVPARPWLIAPAQPPTGSSSPAFAAKSPLPPLIGSFPPPPLSLPAPMFNPATPPYGPHLPPCKPSGGEVSVPPAPAHGGLWCVAKPNVPPETLKEALDYACGEGGADCQAISPHGSCYFPDTIVAHASYAFNSYWQRSKKIGGTCGFEGTAMLINSDPSYRHCRFILA